MILKRKKIVFNIHLLLTFICFIPLIIIALTGSIISYHDNIIEFLNEKDGKLIDIDKKQPLKLSKIIENFSQEIKDYELTFVLIQKDPNMAYIFSGNQDNKYDPYFVDQYTGKIHNENFGLKFIILIRTLHVNLGFSMIGNNELLKLIGNNIVALANISLLILLITGIWLYLPKIKKSFLKSFLINLKAKKHSLFYQLHSALGIWSFIFLLVISTTGIYFSYESIEKLANIIFNPQTWQSKSIPIKHTRATLDKKSQSIQIDNVMKVFVENASKTHEKLIIYFPKRGQRSYNIYYFDDPKDDEKYSRIVIDANRSKVISHTTASEQIIRVLDLHSGFFLGAFGKITFSIASFLCLVFVISGFAMMFYRINK